VRLPNGANAVIDLRKLTEYALNSEHEDGKHKAHLFRELLGIGLENMDVLIDAIKHAAATCDAVLAKRDRYGERYVVDFSFAGPIRSVTVRTAWILRIGRNFLELVTCYIL
jgi:hypothetical protein